MSITTKTGDSGMTSLCGGSRISKASLRVDTYGDIDELSSFLGVAVAQSSEYSELESELLEIQHDLFWLAADFASPNATDFRISSEHVTRLEKRIQQLESILTPQRCFILPGGCPLAAHLHAARTVCRRAERKAVALLNSDD
ncbi:cob(I)yrinic acid a,c-diamide adenosyltransferase, partial [bacterium]|nr:cob(I)yrinic acid a,c-diamide adenosyltransferase [bacterium]